MKLKRYDTIIPPEFNMPFENLLLIVQEKEVSHNPLLELTK